MFYYEDMKSDIVFSCGDDKYTCECWNGVSIRSINSKELLIVTTNCYDEGLHDFVNTYGKFNITFNTVLKNSDSEDISVLENDMVYMNMLLHQSSFSNTEISNHIFVFGNYNATQEDAINLFNQELKDEIIDEVSERLINHMGM